MHILLDVSRFLGSGRNRAPSGIDRVELAYVRRWLREPGAAVTFVARGPWGGYAAVPRSLIADIRSSLEEAWRGTGQRLAAAKRAARLSTIALARLAVGRGRGKVDAMVSQHQNPILLLVSHRLMERAEPIAELRKAGAAFVPLVHDLIPATHPEYARPGVALQHLKRLTTVASLADGVIVNSAATEAVLRPHLVQQSPPPPVLIAPLGIEPLQEGPPPEAGPPYFVVIGTIEPRKNHLLLLHLWRDFAQKFGPAAPRLLLIGKRGWENENVLDLLERCTLLRGLVQEAGQLPDREVASLLAGARALLFPSFAEGYGLPLAEALAAGAPAICSDLPALREVGGDVPEYLDPIDGAGWRRTILDYADRESRARAAQLARLKLWQPPNWEGHFSTVDRLLDRVAGHAGAPALLPAEPIYATRLRERARRMPAPSPVATGDVAVS